MNLKHFTCCGIVEINEKILLVRHTYGTAKGRILLPGGYVQEGELPTKAAEREIYEETGITAQALSVFSVQFEPEQWCVIFRMKYLSGEPKSDHYENDEILLLTAEEAIQREDITNMSKEILKAYCKDRNNVLKKSNYLKKSAHPENYVIFGLEDPS